MSAPTVPATTPEERERYRNLADEHALECAAVEPEHAAAERIAFRDWLAAGAVLLHADRAPRQRGLGVADMRPVQAIALDRWRAWWQSRPDYDGGPQRSPSGVRLRETEVSELRGSTLVSAGRAWVVEDDARGRAALLQHLARGARGGLVIESSASYRRDRDEAGLLSGAIERRGWCPLLAEVRS